MKAEIAQNVGLVSARKQILDRLEQIKANAKLVVEQMRPLCGFDFGYDAQSVKWLDGYIERLRADPETNLELTERLTSVLGSYLGECIIACYGGQWQEDENGLSVTLSLNNAVYPFAKVGKQFANGREDSIASFFEVIPVIFKKGVDGENQNAETARKPWWKLW